ncbi:MAG: hypothetical protein ACRCVT_16170 [Leadbetterella sp.]
MFAATLEGDSDKLAVTSDFELEGSKICFLLSSVTIEERFGQLKTELHAFLNENTGSTDWEFSTKIVTLQTKKKLYKTQDKYEAMLEINPSLDSLRKKLNLDLDF